MKQQKRLEFNGLRFIPLFFHQNSFANSERDADFFFLFETTIVLWHH